ncbi:MAG TPA: acetate--CoA ligase family protein [Acetobacteraceae bacterium]
MNAQPPRLSVREILQPRSVAVFGASDDRDKFGGRIMHFLVRHGFAGQIVPINPRPRQILGRTAYASLADAPIKAEVAILAVPVNHLLGAVEQCAAAGVGCCVIIATGFAEANEAGAALQQRILDVALPAGMRIIGPNCMGLINPGWRLALCSSVVLDSSELLLGHIGLVSQSGALMVSLFDRAVSNGIGFSACVSLGNQSDLEICDFLDYFIDDPGTDALCVYIEGLRDPARFVRAAAACRRAGKPMVVVKTGKTSDGVRAARSHTASLAGDYDAFAAICRAHGVVLADDPVTMVRIADLLLREPLPRSDGIGILSGSGGGTGLMVDRVVGAGLRLARLSQPARAALGELLLPPQADNPIDLGGRLPSQPDDIAAPAMRTLASDPDVGLLLLYLTSMPFFEARARVLAQTALESGKPVIAVMLPGPAADRPRAVLRELGCSYFDSTDDMLAALRGVYEYRAGLTAPTISPQRPDDLPAGPPPLNDVPGLVAAYGIEVPRAVACATPQQAQAAAVSIGFPVVLKGLVSGVSHKTELQAVKTGLADTAAVNTAWNDIAASIARHDLADAFTGCLAQEQAPPGLELILSIRNDPQFGPFVLVGAGGTLVELLHDVASAPAPVSRPQARRLVNGLRCARLLDSWRGGPPRDVEAVIDALERLSWLAHDLGKRLVDLEINPLIAGEAGAGVRAVDIRAEWAESSS